MQAMRWQTLVVALGTAWAGVAGAQTIGMTCASIGSEAQQAACMALSQQITAMIADPAVSRAHWGVMVAGMDGRPIYALNEAQFFQPASNTKLFTTAAAMALLGPATTFQTQAIGVGAFSKDGTTLTGEIVLSGGGDANLSGRDLPYTSPSARPKPVPGAPETDPLRYLATLADDVAATGLKVVTGDVAGDDSLWPWEPYPQDWSIDDAVWGYGAPVSALTVADNQMRLTVTPGTRAGQPAAVDLQQAFPYYTLQSSVVTTLAKSTGGSVQVERAPGARTLRIYGEIAVDAPKDIEEIAIADPAQYAAMAFKAMLEERGIAVRGRAIARHTLPTASEGFLTASHRPLPEVAPAADGTNTPRIFHRSSPSSHSAVAGEQVSRVLATRTSPDLQNDVIVTNKVSQNLHAEMLLHHLGNAYGEPGPANGSTAQGAQVVRQFLVNAGIDPGDFVFYDGSGLSGHDLVTPRATVKLLTWATTQPWFAAWKFSLPVGGEDGSLATRFAKSTLKDKLFAKTGTLGEARALSGYVECASGRTVAFSVMVTDHAPGGHADQETMDRIVTAIAAAN